MVEPKERLIFGYSFLEEPTHNIKAFVLVYHHCSAVTVLSRNARKQQSLSGLPKNKFMLV
jgi:hypothetical protein